MVEQRLCRIIEAVDGHGVSTNGTEIWFSFAGAETLEIVLGARSQRWFDRSASFAISYSGPTDDLSSVFFDAIAHIKAIDDTPIPEAEAAFAEAAARVVQRFAEDGSEAAGEDLSAGRTEGALPEPAPSTETGDESESSTRVYWERPRTRELNVVFLDLFARLVGREGQVSPLHWGYWPVGDNAATPDDYDPFEAFSESLLAHVPASAKRVLDVGCGLGINARILSSRGRRVTAVSPVARHCAVIEEAKLPGVDVKCARFEEMVADDHYDLLLFSESVNHFPLDLDFFAHCAKFLRPSGFILMADDLSDERARSIEEQGVFRVEKSVDISEHVAPTGRWLAQQKRAFTAYRAALMSILEMHDPPVADRVREILDEMDTEELRMLFADDACIPVSKGRYMIYLLQSD